jgi:hypothetical protein
MCFENLPEVVVSFNNEDDVKFIVAVVSKLSGENKTVLRGSDLTHHEYILGRLETEIGDEDKQINCLGGGNLAIDKHKKNILAYSESHDYGRESNRNQTIEMLQRAFPDHSVIGR